MNIPVDYTNLNNQRNVYSDNYIDNIVSIVDTGVNSISSFYIPRVIKKLGFKFFHNNININLDLSTTGYNSDN